MVVGSRASLEECSGNGRQSKKAHFLEFAGSVIVCTELYAERWRTRRGVNGVFGQFGACNNCLLENVADDCYVMRIIVELAIKRLQPSVFDRKLVEFDEFGVSRLLLFYNAMVLCVLLVLRSLYLLLSLVVMIIST
ncbi:hypothetical protein IEQ34_014169 [Dendrobium chrysotoxum]|uniref:Uncharacterized protein n=1 Tax=Dendrobium chrysotoxum TaxID=161865 RepID=A0AAV7GJY3_DENCH|nr:hypothetical protein IEQ34_014169 [Dendrobium chrysotoxum]